MRGGEGYHLFTVDAILLVTDRQAAGMGQTEVGHVIKKGSTAAMG